MVAGPWLRVWKCGAKDHQKNFAGDCLKSAKRQSPACTEVALFSKRENVGFYASQSLCYTIETHIFNRFGEKSVHIYEGSWAQVQRATICNTIPCSLWGGVLALQWGIIWLCTSKSDQKMNYRSQRHFMHSLEAVETNLRSEVLHQKRTFARSVLCLIRVVVVCVVNLIILPNNSSS